MATAADNIDGIDNNELLRRLYELREAVVDNMKTMKEQEKGSKRTTQSSNMYNMN